MFWRKKRERTVRTYATREERKRGDDEMEKEGWVVEDSRMLPPRREARMALRDPLTSLGSKALSMEIVVTYVRRQDAPPDA